MNGRKSEMYQYTLGDVVLEIIKGKVTIVDFCWANDLKQAGVEKWMEEFVSGGTQALKANPKEISFRDDKRKTDLLT